MSQLLGTVISAQITTGDTANTFSIGDTNLMQGGHHSVTYTEERDGISTDRRREGMTCWISGTVATLYRLVGGTNNTDWQEVVSASGGGGASASAAGYFLDDASSGTLAYKTLLQSLTGATEVAAPVTVSSGSLEPLGSFLGPFINRYGIDAGLWQFINYGAVADPGNPAQVVVDIYTRSVAGAETYLFSGTSAAINRTSPLSYSIVTGYGTVPSAVPTDRVVAKYYGLRTATPASVLTFYYSGTNNASMFTTPLGQAHGDLKGLQGGAAREHYHATKDQADALQGWGGAPAAANPYATQVGVQAADTVIQGEINSIMSVLGIGFTGTFSLYMGQFRNGPPDTKITVINGVVVGRVESAYVWEDFENYNTGTLPTLNGGSSWNGSGTVITNPGYGVQAEDNNESYAVGGTIGVTVVLSGGTGWASNGTTIIPWITLVGTETFETYTVGTITTPGTLTDGIGFSGAPAIYAY